jgi:hypothetical protein
MLAPRLLYPNPDFWNVFGHSYFQFSFGGVDQSGRTDSLVRSTLDIEFTNWRNRAVPSSRLIIEGRAQGGFARVLQERVPNVGRGRPYVGEGGATILCYGINDLGYVSNTAQVRTAFQHAMRMAISRMRASTLYENDYQVGTRTSYGAGFTSAGFTSDFSSGNSIHAATSTTSATVTMTLPSDYQGEPVVIAFTGAAGVTGGTVTFSGTAGVTGTLSTSNIMPSASLSHGIVVRRITTLTAANAGQTIIATATAIDGGGAVFFDCWWLESRTPPPVIVCNVARLTSAGYASFPNVSTDADVANLNSDISAVVAEFDSMVQIADLDGAIGGDATLLAADGIHPNELGAARAADAVLAAVRRLSPTGSSTAGNFNVASPRSGGIIKPRISGRWYTTEYRAAGSNYTPVAGHDFAIPFLVCQGRERYIRMGMRLATAGSVAGSIRWGIYDDVGWGGYPQCLVIEPSASGGALSVGTVVGLVQNPASGGGSLAQALDPGLYWLSMLVVTAGTGQAYETLAGPVPLVMPQLDASAARITPSGWQLTGQSTAALPNVFPAGATAVDNVPLVAMQLQ